MDYDLYKKKYPADVLVYIEEFNKNEGTVLFDFIDSKEYNLFINSNNSEYNLYKPSMVLLKNYDKKNIQENTIYSIKQEIIEDWWTQNLINNENDSFLIGYSINLSLAKKEIFTTSISFNDHSDYFFYSGTGRNFNSENIPIFLHGKLSVTIRNVGQGNWNEINVNDEVKFVYDAGASMYATKAEISNIIGDRSVKYSKSKPGLFLSHWDKDHYHSLVGMSDLELKNFSFFVCRDFLPNETCRILHGRILKAIGDINIFNISAEQRISKSGPTHLRALTPNNNPIVIYNSEQHKNRNISGILLSVKTTNSSIVLSGDAHYDQISRDILPHLNYIHEHNLIVPHHGGKAGDYVYNLPYQVKPNRAIISVGSNNYGHPISQYTDALKADQFKISQTRITSNDITINL